MRAAFFVSRQRDDDVAVRHVAFLFEPDQVGNVNRGFVLVIGGATAIEIAVLLDEFEWWQGPVGRIRGDYVDMREQQYRLAFRIPATVTRDEITFALCRHEHLHVLRRKTGGQQLVGHGLRGCRVVAGRMRSIDLDQFAEEVFRHLLVRQQVGFGHRRCRIRVGICRRRRRLLAAGDREKSDANRREQTSLEGHLRESPVVKGEEYGIERGLTTYP